MFKFFVAWTLSVTMGAGVMHVHFTPLAQLLFVLLELMGVGFAVMFQRAVELGEQYRASLKDGSEASEPTS